jgi:hypothetical protein
MIKEGLNININDIEDDDLRKKVIDYFKTWKKGKLDADDLEEVVDDEEKDSKEDEEKNKKDDEFLKMADISDEDIEGFLSESLFVDTQITESEKEDAKREQQLRKLKQFGVDAGGDILKSVVSKHVKDIPYVGKAIAVATWGASQYVKYQNAQADKEAENKKSMDDLKKRMMIMYSASQTADDEKVRNSLKKQYLLLNHCIYDENGEERSPDEFEDALKSTVGRKNYDRLVTKIEEWDTDRGRKKVDKGLKKIEKISKHISSTDLATYEEAAKNARKNERKFAKKGDLSDFAPKNKGSEKEVEKDKDGNIIKQEEITDKDGKKKKVTTHTGPRGGKFYWPDGSPKDAEHKVYIDKHGKVKECMDLSDYLYESFK